MKLSLEPEELVGGVWHRFITRHTAADFPQHAVELKDIQRALSILFRAIGGQAGTRLEGTAPREMLVRRSLLQQIAGNCRQLSVAWCDEQSLRLPARLAAFPDRELNRELYRWLALLAAESSSMHHWGLDNQQWVGNLLARYPSLQPRYHRLVEAHLGLRPDPERLPAGEAELEQCLRRALLKPGSVKHFPASARAPWPVSLWLYPPQGLADPQQVRGGEEQEPGSGQATDEQRLRKQATRVEDHAGKSGLLLFRLENLFSWSEHLDLDRTGDDSDDLDAARVAEDLDELALSRQRMRKAGGIRLDLDLPSAEADDLPLGAGHLLPEWDYRKQQLIERHACVQMMLPRDAQPSVLSEHLQATAKRLRRQFAALRCEPQWRHHQTSGEEVDLQAWIDFSIQQRVGQAAEQGLFIDRRKRSRDLATLLLADLSMSTDAHLDNEHRVIDVIMDGLQLFAEAIEAAGDRFALYGFSSLRRHHVRMLQLKRFDERHDEHVRGRIQALKPGYYTRMGAAIRRAVELLEVRREKRKLLLLVTDGKPNDLDLYEGRYGVEDTRQAVLEARRKGLLVFCITIDREAGDYLPYMFGSHGYLLIRDPVQLPVRLPLLYRQLLHDHR